MLANRFSSFLGGIICGLCFAPIFFLPGVFSTSILLAQIRISKTKYEAIKFGYMFGLGFYLSTLYWISFGVSVYLEQFWWAIPFALFGLPAFLALFTAIIAGATWHFRENNLFHFIFCCIWVFGEWVISWIFTGLPWGLIGYALSNILVLIQLADLTGILGLSFLVIYISSSFYNIIFLLFTSSCLLPQESTFSKFIDIGVRGITSLILIVATSVYGSNKIKNNPTQYLPISARLVQPSIPQKEKWNPQEFWENLNLHVKLSKLPGEPNLIIWSEAALVAPYYIKSIWEVILPIFSNDKQILITGAVTDNNEINGPLEIYSSILGIKSDRTKIFEYHKAHLVPFGEYIPLKAILPIKKITHGIVDYTPGKQENISIAQLNLALQPLICYESIFSSEVKTSNKNVDVIINITNDAWYGNSSGPYQHFEISRMRSIENGLPILRTGNNGISAFIDPIGRILRKTNLNEITVIDNFIPKKLSYETYFSRYGLGSLLIIIILVLILQLTNKYFLVFLLRIVKNA